MVIEAFALQLYKLTTHYIIMKNNKFLFTLLCTAGALMLNSCMKDDTPTPQEIPSKAHGVFIVNEGGFNAGNASLSYYDTDSSSIENAIFQRTNGFNLGDVALSMSIRDSLGYLVVNNSGVIFVININTFKYIGKITGFTSPRYIHFVNNQKAYVSDLYADKITMFNPQTLKTTGTIATKVLGRTQPSTERMVQYKDFVFVSCWSYDTRLLVIDTRTDKAVDTLSVGIQPSGLLIDKYNKIWVFTDGGYDGNPIGHEAPTLCRIDPETRKIEKRFTFKLGDYFQNIALNATADTIYYINHDLYRMPVTAETLPTQAVVKNPNTYSTWYGLGIDPRTSDIYLADAGDYTQPGYVWQYATTGTSKSKFKVGVSPRFFCFR